MSKRRNIITAGAAAAAGVLIAGGAVMATADASSSQTSPTDGYSLSADQQSGKQSATQGGERSGKQDGERSGKQGGPMHEHTEVTGDELARVTEAVTAHDSAITVERVQQDPDGSYDVFGTQDGQRVMVEVSADLASIEVRTGGPGQGGPGGRGGMSDQGQSKDDDQSHNRGPSQNQDQSHERGPSAERGQSS